MQTEARSNNNFLTHALMFSRIYDIYQQVCLKQHYTEMLVQAFFLEHDPV